MDVSRTGLDEAGNRRLILRRCQQLLHPGREVRALGRRAARGDVDLAFVVFVRTEDGPVTRAGTVFGSHNRHRETPTHFRRLLTASGNDSTGQVAEAGGNPGGRLLIDRDPVAVEADEVVRLAVERNGHVGLPFGLKGGVTRTTC